MTQEQTGAIIEAGPSDWQIIQQDDTGYGAIRLQGRWSSDTPGRVEVRLVAEDTAVAVSSSLDWRAAVMGADHHWAMELVHIPAGGLYRLETRFNPEGNLAHEWATHGDMRHFLGVGDLWVIAGQSNSAGYGRGPVYDPTELGVHVLRNSEQWALAAHPLNESTDTRHAVNRENANSGHSPYLHFARLLKQQLNYPIGLVQTALGGSPLSAWNPTEKQPAVLFDNMLHCIRLAGGRVKGILWYQGETDANVVDAPTYFSRFMSAVNAWRTALGTQSLPVITMQLNRVHQVVNPDADLGWAQVREAQRQAPKHLSRVAVVPTLDLPLSDLIHISPAGNMLLAERMARTALGSVYGRPVEYQAPDLTTARLLDGGGEIELSFAPVTSRMDCINLAACPFRVDDERGPVSIKQATYPGDATIHLALDRPLVGRTTVAGCYGADPETAAMDMERFIPMLGFHGVVVE